MIGSASPRAGMPKRFALPARARATDNLHMSRFHPTLHPKTHRREKHPPAIAVLSAGSGALAGGSLRAGVAACAVELAASGPAPADVRLLPAGSFRAWDGRPDDLAAWQMTADDGARLVAEASARTSDRVIDYEHGTMLAKASGGKAPAAGWFRQLEWRPDGLWALGVKWTAQAAKHIADREYRYLSPVFSFDEKTGRVLQLLHASLTNDPGLDGLTDLAALAAELFAPTPTHQEKSMPELLKKLLASLGLQETATEAEALSAVAALKTNVASLSAQVSTPPDPAKYVPIASLSALQAEHADAKGKLAALTAEISAGKVAQLIEDGKAAGKITPATEAWARSLGEKDIAALSAFLDAAPVVVAPGTTQSGGKTPDGSSTGGTAALSALEQQVCAAMAMDLSLIHI